MSRRDATKLIEAWLEDGPDRAPDRILAKLAGDMESTPQIREVGVNRMLGGAIAAAALAAVVLAMSVVWTGAERPTGVVPTAPASAIPKAEWTPAPPLHTHYAAGHAGHFAIATANIGVEYTVPAGVELMVESFRDAAGFAVGAEGFSYGFVLNETNTDASFVPGARGVVVADITRGIWQRNGTGAPLDEPRAVLEGLAADTQATGTIAETDIDGHPALTARLPAHRADTYFRIHPSGRSGGTVYFSHPSSVTLVEVGDLLLLIQVWAGSDAELDAWMPVATTFIDSFRIVRTVPMEPEADHGPRAP